MALSWPTWRQDVPKMSSLEPKMANLARFWGYLGDLLLDFVAILVKPAKIKQNDDSTSLLKVFCGLGGDLGGHVGSSWRYIGPSWPSVGLSLAILALMLGHLDGKLGSEAPRWRPRGPGGASMGGLEALRREEPRGEG